MASHSRRGIPVSHRPACWRALRETSIREIRVYSGQGFVNVAVTYVRREEAGLFASVWVVAGRPAGCPRSHVRRAATQFHLQRLRPCRYHAPLAPDLRRALAGHRRDKRRADANPGLRSRTVARPHHRLLSPTSAAVDGWHRRDLHSHRRCLLSEALISP